MGEGQKRERVYKGGVEGRQRKRRKKEINRIVIERYIGRDLSEGKGEIGRESQRENCLFF